MKIIKEWYGKYGLIARLYVLPEGLFLDYDRCVKTSNIYVKRLSSGKILVTASMPDVPKKYYDEITKLVRAGKL